MSEKDFDKGYKSGFNFGKEVANEEWLNRVKQVKKDIYEQGWFDEDNNWFMFRQVYVGDVFNILDKLIESEGE